MTTNQLWRVIIEGDNTGLAQIRASETRPASDFSVGTIAIGEKRLMDAAPDLLAACEAALPYVLGHSSMSCGGKCNICAVRDQLRAAIAKARP